MAHLQNFVIERDLSRLSIDPESWCLNLDYAYELLDMGITLSVDAFGQIYDREFAGFVQPTDWQRMGALIKLIREGYSSQLVIGTDSFLKISARRFGGEGYCRLTNHVIPYMEKLSISKNVINKITVDNPIRLLQV